MAKVCADCGFEDCGLECALWRFRDLGRPQSPIFVGRFGFCAGSGAERPPRELRGPTLTPFLGQNSSSSERLK
eukprot:6646404-Alexandrium_andersonii.AAC.1